MLSRVLSVAIVIFWGTMTTMLVRSELWPDRSALRTMPVEHVGKILWLHQQASTLVIWRNDLRLGALTLHPQVRAGDQTRILNYSGNLQLRIPGAGRPRLLWDGVAEYSPDWEMQNFMLGLGLRDSFNKRAEIQVAPQANQASYRLLKDGIETEKQTFSLDEVGLRRLMERLDFDPTLLTTLGGSRQNAPEITAQQSSLQIHKERIDTYLLTLRQNGQTLLEAHVSQLGQFLQIKTIIGYTLAPEDLLP